METLAEKMRVRMRVDDCGDRTIIGKHGDIHRGTYGGGISGYYVSLLYTSARKFHIELARLAAIGEITGEGDTEGIVFIPRQVALGNAALIRRAIHAKQIRRVSAETAAKGAERLKNWRESQRTGVVTENEEAGIENATTGIHDNSGR